MKVLIIGGAGMVGRKLAERLARDGRLGTAEISALTLYDVVAAEKPKAAKFPVAIVTGDLPEAGETDKLVAGKPDIIFHLAAIVSGEAELEFDKGYRINMHGTLNLLESVRHAYAKDAKKPRVVFTSSIAVFGAPFPEKIHDEFIHAPLTSYGAQKAIGELLLSDYTRKGMLDGIGIRLPTVCVRPGKPNKAASGFFSNICREPLAGVEAVLPVTDDVMHWHASPRAAVGFLLHAALIDGEKVGTRRSLTMPGLAATIGEQIAALKKVGGDKVVKRIRREPDPFVQKIVAGWPRNFDARRATALGFTSESTFEEILRVHIEDELGGTVA